MFSKKHIVLTAIITFILTAAVMLLAVVGEFAAMMWSVSGTGLQKLKRIEGLVDAYYIYDCDKEKMEDFALVGYTYAIGDPYTTYIDAEEFQSMKETVTGDYVGIGVEIFIDSDNLITIISPFDESPAQKAGILPGDKIVAVDGKEVSSSNYNDAVNMIKGEATGENEDSKVALTIKRGEELLQISVRREKIVTITAKEKMLSKDIGYIRISNFDDNTPYEFSGCVEKIQKQGAKGLVIDLRNNPGGTLDSVVEVADMLLPRGNIITIKDKQGNETKYDSDAKHFEIPVCVLINGNSASAAEALAGAISDSGRGKLVGEKSFGKGSVQSIFELGDGTALKVTAAKYYTPGGKCIDKTGIKPDYEVFLEDSVKDLPVTGIPYGKDLQLKKAMEILEKN